MPLSPIASFTGTNVPGNCWLDFIDVRSIATFPDEINSNLVETITLTAGASWTRIVGHRLTLELEEQWAQVDGVLQPSARLKLDVSQDDTNKLPGLWLLQHERHVVLVRNRNGQTLCMGSKDEGARFGPVKRSTGRTSGDLSGYELSWSIARETPMPFYLGTPPGVAAGGGGVGAVVVVDGIQDTIGTPDQLVVTML